jgi:hypothetical protein
MRLSETSSALERLGKILFQQECPEAWRGKISETELCGLLGAVDRHIQDQAGLFRRFTVIGLSLSKEKNIMDILEKILTFARELTNADAGTLYLLDSEEGEYLIGRGACVCLIHACPAPRTDQNRAMK